MLSISKMLVQDSDASEEICASALMVFEDVLEPFEISAAAAEVTVVTNCIGLIKSAQYFKYRILYGRCISMNGT